MMFKTTGPQSEAQSSKLGKSALVIESQRKYSLSRLNPVWEILPFEISDRSLNVIGNS